MCMCPTELLTFICIRWATPALAVFGRGLAVGPRTGFSPNPRLHQFVKPQPLRTNPHHQLLTPDTHLKQIGPITMQALASPSRKSPILTQPNLPHV